MVSDKPVSQFYFMALELVVLDGVNCETNFYRTKGIKKHPIHQCFFRATDNSVRQENIKLCIRICANITDYKKQEVIILN